MLDFYVSLGYSIVNSLLALLILVKSRRNVLNQFYAFCVLCLIVLGGIGQMLRDQSNLFPLHGLERMAGFLFAVFPFFFLHFMLVFVRRYEILNSKSVIIANYFVGLFSYTLVILGYIPNPFTVKAGVSVTGFVYYITWMSILFSVGVALLYSLIGGFSERGMKSNLLFISLVFLMLLLPTPFTLTLFSAFTSKSANLYFISSMCALAVVVYIVFRHRITQNTPYQAMKSALAAMNDILIKTNQSFKIEMVQGAVLPLLGYQEEDLVGHSIHEIVGQERLLERYQGQVLRGETKELFFDAEVGCKSARSLPMEFSFTPVLGNEEITGFVAVGRNITERRRAEKALQESEARYRSLFESNPNPLWVYDRKTLAYLVVNDAAVRHYGYSHEEFLTMTIKDILSPGDARFFSTEDDEYVRTFLKSGTWKHQKKDGTLIDVEITSHELEFGEHPARLVLVNDVTERKKAEEALRASEEKYRQFFEEDLTGDVTATVDGRLLACNPAYAQIFGFASVDGAMATKISALYPNPDAYQAFLHQLQEKKRLEYYETELKRVDGARVYVVENVIGTFDSKGTLVGLKCYIFDNTERKRLEDQLRQAQKLENLGTLAGGIAHDFNNTLAIILANASLLKRIKSFPDRFPQSVETIQKAVERASGMVRQLMTFARKADTMFEPVNVNAAVEEITTLLRSTFPKTITFSRACDENLPDIIADPNQLHQTLMNLCVNARDAILAEAEEGSGGTISISTGTIPGPELRLRFSDASADTYVVIRLSDTGTGMDETTRHRIFEPFFTTKGAGKGTGLGLAVVYGVVKSHRGLIDVNSEVGHGTTFSLYFPVSSTIMPARGKTAESSAQIAGGNETILLVEDEEMLLDSLRVLLEDQGYRVLTAKDGEQAVTVYAQHQEEIAFVFSDVGLPKLGGWEAFQKMKTANPKVKVIFGSGHIDPIMKTKMLQGGAVDFIPKPYMPDEILERIREVICN